MLYSSLCDQLSSVFIMPSDLCKVQTQSLLAPTTAHPSDRVTDQPRAAPFKKRNRWGRRKRGISGAAEEEAFTLEGQMAPAMAEVVVEAQVSPVITTRYIHVLHF